MLEFENVLQKGNIMSSVAFQKSLLSSRFRLQFSTLEKTFNQLTRRGTKVFLFTCSEYLKVAFTSEPAEGVFLFFKILFMLGMTLRLPH